MLKIKDLTVKVADKNILNKFNLEANEGSIHAIMGPNGVGKSTICKVLLGDPFYEIQGGSIFYDGKNLKDLSTTDRARLGIYLLSQNPIQVEGITNAEMLRTALSDIKNENIGIFQFNKKLESICEELNIPKSFIHKNINEGASGGERKKIELMHLWMLEPKLILLDELDSGLDVDALKIVIKSIKKYHKTYNPTIIIITHHLKVLNLIIPDFVHVLKEGTIVASGDKELAEKIEKDGFNEAFTITKEYKNE